MIYLDNASTSFPKAPGVAEYVKNFIETSCFNVTQLLLAVLGQENLGVWQKYLSR